MDPEEFRAAENKELTASKFMFSHSFDLFFLPVPMNRSGERFDIMISCHDEKLRKILFRPSK